jgi:hypothetical protein
LDKREKKVSIVLTPKQYEEWREESEKRDMTMAAFVRYCVHFYLTTLKRYKELNKEK